MNSFYAAVEHFGKARYLCDLFDGETGFAEQFRGTAGGEQFHAEAIEGLRKFEETMFIGDTEQRTLNSSHKHSFWQRGNAYYCFSRALATPGWLFYT
jgi:hypothetical protein